jgi:hypothetical protein
MSTDRALVIALNITEDRGLTLDMGGWDSSHSSCGGIYHGRESDRASVSRVAVHIQGGAVS